jgi:hydroxyethylthiazole kinase-like uncharacterized protein yjeF
MFRSLDAVLKDGLLALASVVCGCGAGQTIAQSLPEILDRSRTLVLDADALNAIATDTRLQAQLKDRSERGQCTVITPHPLEAARLLGSSTTEVMCDRLAATRQLVERFGVVCVLKGSGSVVGSPGNTPRINPTGNAALATAGTGDVLAGMIGSAIAAQGLTPDELMQPVCKAVFLHGWLADHWAQRGPTHENRFTLTASGLAQSVLPLR